MNAERISDLVKIICDYRKDELSFPIDAYHVKRWLDQFDKDAQQIILDETIHIFSSWYFTKEKFIEFYDEVLKHLGERYQYDEEELLKNIVFVSANNSGNSQKAILKQLDEIALERYGFGIRTTIDSKAKVYVFIDDGLFTGRTACKDLKEVILRLPMGASLDAYYLIGTSLGLDYTKKQLKSIAQERKIDLNVFRFKFLSNDKQIKTETYNPHHLCLWPESSVESIPSIKEYIDNSIVPKFQSEGSKYYLFRNVPWINDSGIFNSVNNRRIVEKEFLEKGIEITKRCKQDNGLFPLGYSPWSSFGFGSFCATFMNVSNTCPLVLWWTNNPTRLPEFDFWYPLLPRRINNNDSDRIDFID